MAKVLFVRSRVKKTPRKKLYDYGTYLAKKNLIACDVEHSFAIMSCAHRYIYIAISISMVAPCMHGPECCSHASFTCMRDKYRVDRLPRLSHGTCIRRSHSCIDFDSIQCWFVCLYRLLLFAGAALRPISLYDRPVSLDNSNYYGYRTWRPVLSDPMHAMRPDCLSDSCKTIIKWPNSAHNGADLVWSGR